jgi:hypothetical protein
MWNFVHFQKQCIEAMMVMKLAQLEHEIEKLQAEKKNLVKKHLEEMKARDGKEFSFFSVLCACVLVYACLSMISGLVSESDG